MENAVNIIVKAPNQKIEDKLIACHVQWTVKKLKEHLSDVYPLKPQPCEQKLVYYGKLMPDKSTLNDVLTQEMYNGYHTIHLICPQNSQLPYIGSPDRDNFLRADQLKEPQEPSNTSMPTADPNSPYTGMTGVHGGPQLRYRLANTHVNSNAQPQGQTQELRNFYQWYTATYGQALAVQSPQQALMVQQYCQQVLRGANPLMYQNIQPQIPVVEAVQPAQGAQQPAAAQQDDGENGVVRMNAQGGADADAVPNDWLDSLYFFIRILILGLVMYGSISFTRFLMVIGGCMIFYAVQVGIFRPQRRAGARLPEDPAAPQNVAGPPPPPQDVAGPPPPPQDVAGPPPQDNRQDDPPQQVQDIMDGPAADIANNNQAPDGVQNNPAPNPPVPEQSTLSIIVEAIVAFFTSIFP